MTDNNQKEQEENQNTETSYIDPTDRPLNNKKFQQMNPFGEENAEVIGEDKPLPKGGYNLDNLDDSAFQSDIQPTKKKATKKPPARFASKLKEKEESQQNEANNEEQQNKADNNKEGFEVITNDGNNDEKPLNIQRKESNEKPLGGKGGGYNLDNLDESAFQPSESSKSIKKPTKSSTLAKKKVQAPTTTTIPSETNEQFDEKPIGGSGGGYNIDSLDEKPIGGKGGGYNIDSLDEKPIGGGNKGGYNLDDLEEGDMGAQQTEEIQLPLATRLKSKIFKQRQSGYEELQKLLENPEQNRDILSEYGATQFQTYISDSNPGAQEQALKALDVWILLNISKLFDADGKEFTKILIDKCYGPGKPSGKKLSLDIILNMFEKGSKEYKQGVCDGIIVTLQQKNQKTIIGGVIILCEMLQNFGPVQLSYLKPFFPEIEKLAGSSVAGIRTEVMKFYKDAYMWLGLQILQPYLTKIKKAQVDEIEKYAEENPRTQMMVPLRIDQKSQQAQSGGKGGNQMSLSLDPYDISDPVDIFAKQYTEAWSEKVLQKAKWNEKKEELDKLLQTIQLNPKIVSQNHHFMASFMKKILGDANFNVQLCAVKILGSLANSMRKGFFGQAKMFFPLLVQKFKDKKTQMIEETHKTLESFFHSITLDDFLDDFKEALQDKTPVLKSHLLEFFTKYLVKFKDQLKKMMGSLSQVIKLIAKMTEDGNSEVRDKSLQALATFKAHLNDDKESGPLLKEVTGAKLQKLNDMVVQITGKKDTGASQESEIKEIKQKPESQQKPDVNQNKTQQKVEESKQKENTVVEKKQSEKPNLNKTQKTLNHSQSQSNLSLNSNQQSSNQQSSSANMTLQDALNLKSIMEILSAQEIIQNTKIQQVFVEPYEKGKSPQDKVAALNQLTNMLQEKVINNQNIEALLVVVRALMKDWKESNLNITKELLQFLTELPKSDVLTKQAFTIIFPYMQDKLGDAKFNEIVSNFILNCCQFMSPKFVSCFVLGIVLKETKKPGPKMLMEVCNIVNKMIQCLTTNALPIKDVIDFVKLAFANAAAAQRAPSMNLFKTLYQHTGKSLEVFIKDMNPQSLKTLQGEFEKLTPLSESEMQPTLEFRGEAQQVMDSLLGGGGQKGKKGKPAGAGLLDLIPMTDISANVNKVLKKLEDKDWKVQKEGIEEIEKTISQANDRISSNGLGDFVQALKKGLKDKKNKSLLRLYVNLLGKVVEAAGKDFTNNVKQLIGPLMSSLADKQVLMHTDVLNSIEKIEKACGQELVCLQAIQSLIGEKESVEMRVDLLGIIIRNHESLAKQTLQQELKTLVSYTVNLLCDKNKDIRNKAEELVEKIFLHTDMEHFASAVKDLKPALQSQVKVILQKYSGGIAVDNIQESLNNQKTNPSPNKQLSKSQSNLELSNNKQNTKKQQSKNGAKQPANSTAKKLNMTLEEENEDQDDYENQSMMSQTQPNMFLNQIQLNVNQPNNQPNQINIKQPISEILTNNNYQQQPYQNNNFNSANMNSSISQFNVPQDFSQEDNNFNPSYNQSLNNSTYDQSKNNSFYQQNQQQQLQQQQQQLLQQQQVLQNQNMQQNSQSMFNSQQLTEQNQKLIKQNQDLLNQLQDSRQIFQKSQAELQQLQNQNYYLNQQLIQNINSNNTNEQILKVQQMYQSQFQQFQQSVIETFEQQKQKLQNKYFNKVAAMDQRLYQLTNKLRITKQAYARQKEQFRQQKMQLDIQQKQLQIKNQLEQQQLKTKNQLTSQPSQKMLNKDINSQSTKSLAQSLQQPQNQNNNQQFQQQQFNQNSFQQQQIFSQGLTHSQSQRRLNLDEVNNQQKIQFELTQHLFKLIQVQDLCDKMNALFYINNLIFQNNFEILLINTEQIVSAIIYILQNAFNNHLNNIYNYDFNSQFLNLTYKLFQIQQLTQNIQKEQMQILYEEIQKRFILEDDIRNTVKENVEQHEFYIKQVNGSMILLLDNSNPSVIYNVLFDCLIKFRRQSQNSKYIQLIIKCVLKVTKDLTNKISFLDIDMMFIKFHEYLNEFAPDFNKNQDDLGIKAIKTIVLEISKIKKEDIWNHYSVISNLPTQDHYIGKWIQIMLKSFNQQVNTPNITSQITPKANNININNKFAQQQHIQSIQTYHQMRLQKQSQDQQNQEQVIDNFSQFDNQSVVMHPITFQNQNMNANIDPQQLQFQQQFQQSLYAQQSINKGPQSSYFDNNQENAQFQQQQFQQQQNYNLNTQMYQQKNQQLLNKIKNSGMNN